MNLIIASAHAEVVNELPMPTWAFGVMVFAILMFLLLATMSLRSVAMRRDADTNEVAVRQRDYNWDESEKR